MPIRTTLRHTVQPFFFPFREHLRQYMKGCQAQAQHLLNISQFCLDAISLLYLLLLSWIGHERLVFQKLSSPCHSFDICHEAKGKTCTFLNMNIGQDVVLVFCNTDTIRYEEEQCFVERNCPMHYRMLSIPPLQEINENSFFPPVIVTTRTSHFFY